MGDHLRDLNLIDRKGWLTFALCVGALLPVVAAGIIGDSIFAVVVLAVISAMWCLLLQLSRGILKSALEVAQESTHEWQVTNDLIQVMTDDYVDTIHELSRFDIQSSGIHLERLRAMMIKRYPEMEDKIAQVQHPLNMPGVVI